MSQYDIRVVRMAKSTQETNLGDIICHMSAIDEKRRTKQKSKPVNMCLCLGHFDVMMIDQIGQNNSSQDRPIQLVSKDYNRAWDIPKMLKFENRRENYALQANYYPIYMLLQYEDGNKYQIAGVNAFWKKSHNFIVVTRFHQDYDSIVQKSDQFTDLLKTRLFASVNTDTATFTDISENNSVYYSLGVIREGKKNTVYCIFYDSLELGDVVCVFKSNSLSAILEVQRWLYESPDVSDAYSYCGMHYRNFIDSDKDYPKDTDLLRTTHIDYVETRYSVENSDLAWEFFQKELKQEGYYVTGNADALIHQNRISEMELLESIRALVCFQGVYDAFNDVITRVGLINRKPVRDSNHQIRKRQQLRKAIALTPETYKWLVNNYKLTNHPEGGSYVVSVKTSGGGKTSTAVLQSMYRYVVSAAQGKLLWLSCSLSNSDAVRNGRSIS